jgi:putative endonuclease
MPADTTAQEKGALGEQAARDYLETKGYFFVAKNWSCKTGEIDLIMNDGMTRVFVEVRLRSKQSQYGNGLDTVSYQKQRKLIKTANFYQQLQNYWGDIRFDVISITEDSGNLEFEHIPYAFEAI